MNKNSVKYLVVFLMSFLNGQLTAQEIQWANHAGSSGGDFGGTSIIDRTGNIYFCGIFTGNECYFNTDTLFQWGDNGMFIVKYDAGGKEIWVKRYGNYNEGIPVGFSDMVYDSSANVIFCVGIIYITGTGYRNFLAKLDTEGNVIWMKKYLGVSEFSTQVSGFSALALDEEKNIYATGSVAMTVNFDTVSVAPGGFIAKFDSSGTCIWGEKKFGYNQIVISEVRTTGIQVSMNKIFVAGFQQYDGTIIIDTMKISHKGFGSSMVMCFDKNCSIQWIAEGVAKHTSSYSDIAIDKSSNLYYTGTFTDTITFSGNRLISQPGRKDMFLVKYDQTGRVQWLSQSDAQSAEGLDVITDANSNTYVTGYFAGEGSFGNHTVKSLSSRDLFLARYTLSGECKGVINFPNGNGNGLSQDKEGNACFMYIFSGTTQVGHQSFESYGASDFIFSKISAITGIAEPKGNLQNKLLIYANPTTGKCTITIPEDFLKEKALTLHVYDSNGKLIEKTSVTLADGKIRLNLEAQAKGIYHVTLDNGEKRYGGKVVFE